MFPIYKYPSPPGATISTIWTKWFLVVFLVFPCIFATSLNQTARIISASVTDGGSQIESVEEIKFRAPKFYAAQNRAVTNNDYRTIIQQIYPAASDVYVYGGQELDIPEYGRVFIAVKPNTGETISNVTKNSIVKSLDEFRVSSIEVIIVDQSDNFNKDFYNNYELNIKLIYQKNYLGGLCNSPFKAFSIKEIVPSIP